MGRQSIWQPTAIANGILATVEEEARKPACYQIQVGAYQNRDIAERPADRLEEQGFPAFVVYQDGFYKVRIGAFLSLDNAAQMERNLRDISGRGFKLINPNKYTK